MQQRGGILETEIMVCQKMTDSEKIVTGLLVAFVHISGAANIYQH
jgi:hypothetical protein